MFPVSPGISPAHTTPTTRTPSRQFAMDFVKSLLPPAKGILPYYMLIVRLSLRIPSMANHH